MTDDKRYRRLMGWSVRLGCHMYVPLALTYAVVAPNQMWSLNFIPEDNHCLHL
jgi:hypothetical protein